MNGELIKLVENTNLNNRMSQQIVVLDDNFDGSALHKYIIDYYKKDANYKYRWEKRDYPTGGHGDSITYGYSFVPDISEFYNQGLPKMVLIPSDPDDPNTEPANPKILEDIINKKMFGVKPLSVYFGVHVDYDAEGTDEEIMPFVKILNVQQTHQGKLCRVKFDIK